MKNANIKVITRFMIACPQCGLMLSSREGGFVLAHNNIRVTGTIKCKQCHRTFAVPVLKLAALHAGMMELRVARD